VGREKDAELTRVLVTGGGGFLGSAVCRQLASAGHEVIAFQRRPADHLECEGITSLQGDICKMSDLLAAAKDCGAIIHTAGKAGIWGDATEYRRINVNGTSNVIETCRLKRVPILVHTSSPSIVHSGDDLGGADESIPIAEQFTAPYPATKAESEKMVIAANKESLRTTALRPHLIWGPGDPHILPRLVEKARRGSIALPGPDKIIDTIFVENAALAHLKAFQELQGSAKCAGKSYFVTNNEPMPQGEIVRKLLAAVGIEVKIRAIPVPIASVAGIVSEFAWRTLKLESEPPVTRFSIEQLATAHWFDTSAAERDFDYRPQISIAEGLELLRKAGL
jgi:nucleoside-diphosphate-sugar epimerase